MTDLTPAVRADLASTGTLRAAINYGNFILATKDRATGESRGVAIDLTQELGRRLAVPVEIVAYDSVAVMGDAAPTGVWDIAFLGSDPKREALMSFTAAYLEIEATYLVPERLAAAHGGGRRPRRRARRGPGPRQLRALPEPQPQARPARVDRRAPRRRSTCSSTGQVEALAGLTQALLDRLEQLPGSRLVEGRFMGVQQSIAVPKGREAGLAYLRRVVEDAKASGLVARAIERTGARGVSVAPAAK